MNWRRLFVGLLANSETAARPSPILLEDVDHKQSFAGTTYTPVLALYAFTTVEKQVLRNSGHCQNHRTVPNDNRPWLARALVSAVSVNIRNAPYRRVIFLLKVAT